MYLKMSTNVNSILLECCAYFKSITNILKYATFSPGYPKALPRGLFSLRLSLLPGAGAKHDFELKFWIPH